MTITTARFAAAEAPVQPTATGAPFESGRARRWTSLLDRIAEGDLDACGAFYDESSQLTFSLIMQTVGDKDLAEDMLVDLYVDIRNRAQRGEHRHRNALTWVIELAQDAVPRPVPCLPAAPYRQVTPFEIAWLLGSWVAI